MNFHLFEEEEKHTTFSVESNSLYRKVSGFFFRERTRSFLEKEGGSLSLNSREAKRCFSITRTCAGGEKKVRGRSHMRCPSQEKNGMSFCYQEVILSSRFGGRKKKNSVELLHVQTSSGQQRR